MVADVEAPGCVLAGALLVGGDGGGRSMAADSCVQAGAWIVGGCWNR